MNTLNSGEKIILSSSLDYIKNKDIRYNVYNTCCRPYFGDNDYTIICIEKIKELDNTIYNGEIEKCLFTFNHGEIYKKDSLKYFLKCRPEYFLSKGEDVTYSINIAYIFNDIIRNDVKKNCSYFYKYNNDYTIFYIEKIEEINKKYNIDFYSMLKYKYNKVFIYNKFYPTDFMI